MSHEVIHFTVLGDPKGKARPKFRRLGKITMTYTPKATVEYENSVRKAFIDTVGKNFVPIDGPIETEIKCVFKIPDSASKRKHNDMVGMPALRKPDLDNIAKSILDPLNTIAYTDDSQICKISGSKEYGDEPRVEVTIKPYGIIYPIHFINKEEETLKQ